MMVAFRLDRTLYDALRRGARADERNLSSFMRRALAERVSEYMVPPPARSGRPVKAAAEPEQTSP